MKMQTNFNGEPELRIPVKESLPETTPREVFSLVQAPRHEALHTRSRVARLYLKFQGHPHGLGSTHMQNMCKNRVMEACNKVPESH